MNKCEICGLVHNRTESTLDDSIRFFKCCSRVWYVKGNKIINPLPKEEADRLALKASKKGRR